MNMISTDYHSLTCSCFYAILPLIEYWFYWFMCTLLKLQPHCANLWQRCSWFILVHFAVVIWDKLLPTRSAEDAAMARVGMKRVLVRLSMNLPANPLRFIMATPQPIQYNTRQPHEWARMKPTTNALWQIYDSCNLNIGSNNNNNNHNNNGLYLTRINTWVSTKAYLPWSSLIYPLFAISIYVHPPIHPITYPTPTYPSIHLCTNESPAFSDTDCCTRQFLGVVRPFLINLIDMQGSTVLQMERGLRCQGCCCPCCLQEMDILIPGGQKIATIKEV